MAPFWLSTDDLLCTSVETPKKPTPKKAKFELSKEMKGLVDADEENKAQWKVILEECKNGKVGADIQVMGTDILYSGLSL